MLSRLATPIAVLGLVLGIGLHAPEPATAQTAPLDAASTVDVAPLFEALGLPEMIEIMREEGLDYGRTIATDLFTGRSGADWTATVGEIYDAGRMRAAVEAAMTSALADADLEPILDFFTSDTGRNIIGLEVSARRALLDDAVEEASKAAAAIAQADATPRFQQVDRFVTINDLVETNVVGALNSNYAFYVGLGDGGAFPQAMAEDQILADVWAQEGEIRQNTTEWVYSFLMMAYQPLSDEDMEAYIAFSETEAGQTLNRTMFAAFDEVFTDISLALGLAASRYMVGQEL
jgi:hypothetical protein